MKLNTLRQRLIGNLEKDLPIEKLEKDYNNFKREEHYQDWLTSTEEEYQELFSEYKEEVVKDEETDEEITEQVKIDYTDDDSYLSLDDWRTERKLTTDTETYIDEDGEEQVRKVEVYVDVRPYEFDESILDFQTFLNNDGRAYKKRTRDALVNQIAVTINAIEYDGDEKSQDRMNRIAGIANFKFIYNLMLQMKEAVKNYPDEPMILMFANTIIALYQAVYKDNKIPWVGTDNKVHTVQIETMIESMEKALEEMSKEFVK